MSRGLGKVQRLVLEALEERQHIDPEWRWLNANQIAHRRVCDGRLEWDGGDFGGEWKCESCGGHRRPSAADLEAVRRALRTLAKADRIEVAHYDHPTPVDWQHRRVWSARGTTARKMLTARLPLTPDEAELEAERKRARRKQLAAMFRQKEE